MALELASRHFGGAGKPALVILHGLLGSSRNWMLAGKLLAEDFEVFALDLRGHGDSPFAPAPEHDYSFPAFAGDVGAWLAVRGLKRPLLLGHSLGGKVAMRAAVDAPEHLRGIIVADISPRDYDPHHVEAFKAMRALDVAALSSRADAEKMLAAQLNGDVFARFLLTNLARGEDGKFHWRADIEGLQASLPQLARSPLKRGEIYAGPVLVLRGGESEFIRDTDFKAIAAHFPRHQLATLHGAGHNLHVERPKEFADAVKKFLAESAE